MGKLLEFFNDYVETKGSIEKVRLEYIDVLPPLK